MVEVLTLPMRLWYITVACFTSIEGSRNETRVLFPRSDSVFFSAERRLPRAFCFGCIEKLGEGTAAALERSDDSWSCPCCDETPLDGLQVLYWKETGKRRCSLLYLYKTYQSRAVA